LPTYGVLIDPRRGHASSVASWLGAQTKPLRPRPFKLEPEAHMREPTSDLDQQAESREAPLLPLRAVVLLALAVLAAIVSVMEPAASVGIGVGVGVLALLHRLIGR
jgi:hypothetical protein